MSALGYGSGRIYHRERLYNPQLSLKVPVKYTFACPVSCLNFHGRLFDWPMHLAWFALC